MIVRFSLSIAIYDRATHIINCNKMDAVTNLEKVKTVIESGFVQEEKLINVSNL